MKTILLISLFLALTSTAFTQINKGQFLIGGKISLESIKEENPRNDTHQATNFYISPDIGYFIINKMATGLRLDFLSYNSKSGGIETHTNVTTISPFIRYYFLPSTNKVNALIDVGYIHNKTKWSGPNSQVNEKSNGYNISAGPSIFLTDRIALEFILGFKHTKSANYGYTKSNAFNSGFGLQIHLGKVKNRSKI
jgi:hypothetical protein